MVSGIYIHLALSLLAGFIIQSLQIWIQSSYFSDFLKANLINLLIALLAINSATLGVVLTKLRDLMDKSEQKIHFKKTKAEMLLSIKEQIVMIAASVVTLTLWNGKRLEAFEYKDLLLGSVATAIFVWSMIALYDIAKSILIIIDYDS